MVGRHNLSMYVEATARIQMWTEAQCYTEILY